MRLDRVDAEILRALQEDARLSLRALSRRVGMSVPAVGARVANLEDLGVVAGYHASVEPERLGQVPVVVVVACTPSGSESAGQAVAALPEVRRTIVTRDHRVVADATLSHETDLEPFLDRVRSLGGVRRVRAHVAVRRFKDAARATLDGSLTAVVECFECGRGIEGDPVRIRLGGRTHYLCCRSCEALYRERYARIQARAAHGRRVSPRTTGRTAPARTSASP